MDSQRYLHHCNGDLRYKAQADYVIGWFRSRLCFLLVVLVPKVRIGDPICSSLHISSNRRSCLWTSRWSDHWSHGRCKRPCWLAMALCKSGHHRLVHLRILISFATDTRRPCIGCCRNRHLLPHARLPFKQISLPQRGREHPRM